MRDLALSLGAPAGALLLEPRSRNTRENFLEARALLTSAGISHALLVTEPYHMPRALLLARRAGLRVDPSPAAPELVPFAQRFRQSLREYPLLVVTALGHPGH